MRFTMSMFPRGSTAAAVALAAAGVIGSLVPVVTPAEATPRGSPFMGTYNGAVPDAWDAIWTITVSKTGGVSGTVTTGSYFVMSGTISGSVSDAGALSVHGSALYAWHGCSLDGCVGRDKPQKAPIKFDGTVTLDAAGNITGIATNPDWVNPETIFWQRL